MAVVWEPNPRPSNPDNPVFRGMPGSLFGHGSPIGSVYGWGGWSYLDLDTGDEYLLNAQGYTNNGWAIASGGSGAVQVYEGRDPAPPDDTTKAAVSFPTDGGQITQWSPNSQAWV